MLNEPAVERPSRRGTALRVAALLAGVLSLALAAVLIFLPSSLPTLDPLPIPDRDRERGRGPVAALSTIPTAAPIGSPADPSPSATPKSTTPETGTPKTAAPEPSATEPTAAPTPAPTAAPTATADPSTARGALGVPPAEARATPRVVTKIRPDRPRRSRKPAVTLGPARTAAPGHVLPGLPRLPNSIKGRGPAK